ncbi:hypothetical protein AHMF7605_07685 [Adhaeribacter arboris]|uniref:Uncharacterized protein n=1 Tax=Adhaeribacter arboris TaxID=2072846 RepID=A0A2T2YD96_9BACT|nr:hypothetical protein [Adhaeribacter arboris]PSR53418.1 hypothetical protein AHMF7605_07685 [Adhaeribacter arboris]
MRAIQKIIHYTLILAITLASAGFRIAVSNCSSNEMEKAITTSTHSNCCCKKPAPKSKTTSEDCGLGTCVVPTSVYCSLNSRQAYEQVAKLLRPINTYAVYAEVIYPALQEAQPYFTLPPPSSGRLRGILHQVFLI